MAFPKVDKKLTRNLDSVPFVLQEEGDSLEGVYAGSGTYKFDNGKTCACHYIVTDDGVATVLSRFQIDKFLDGKKTGTRVSIERGPDRHFKKNGEDRTMFTFKCE